MQSSRERTRQCVFILFLSLPTASVLGETVVVDNTSSAFSVISGTWNTGTDTGKYGDNYRYKTTGASVGGEVRWQPTLQDGGEYEVSVWYYSQAASPNDARYVVHHSAGTTNVYVNQQIYGSQWVSLGVFVFGAGTSGKVTMTDQAQPGKTIAADAVRFQTMNAPPPQFRAVWADVFHEGLQNAAQVDAMIQRAVQGGYNAIIPEVLAFHDNDVGSHGAYWRSNIVARSVYVKDDFEPLGYIIEKARLHGLEVHPWLVAYRVSSKWPPPGNAFLAAHPEWLMVPRANMGTVAKVGGSSGYYTFDAGSPEVQEYLLSIVREIASNYDVDGIHWDYIRYTQTDAGYPADNNYENSGLARFRRICGRTDVPTATGDTQWNDFRRRSIDELIRRCRAEIPTIDSPRQPLRHTASLIPWGNAPADFTNSSAYGLFQNWEMWMRLGWLDAAVPMMYYREYDANQAQWYRNWVNAAVNWRYDRHLFVGQANYLNIMTDSFTQMLHAESKGVDGLVNYSYGSTVDPDKGGSGGPVADYSWYPFVNSTVYNRAADPPSMPWRNPTLATEGTLYGRVIDAWSGRPIDDAAVQVGTLDPVPTDGNGYFVATMIPSQGLGWFYDVTVTREAFPPLNVTNVLVAAGDVERHDFSLGLLNDCNGNGIEDVCDVSCDAPGCGSPACALVADCNDNGVPDTCEPGLDADGDRVLDPCDNCPSMPNADQADGDGDGVGDACDQCPNTIAGSAVDALGCPGLIPMDFDRDGDVDHDDLQIMEACASGPGVGQLDPACDDKDADSDSDVDQVDFGVFQQCMSGANVPADPGCPGS